MKEAAVSASALPSESGPTDQELMTRIAKQDEKAFRLLADRHTGLLFNMAYRMNFSRAQAEDIVQETLFRVWQKAGDWDPNKGASPRTWMCRIATNLCIDNKRKAVHEYDGEAPERADTAPSAQAVLEADEAGGIVGRALQDLPARQRSAMVLFHYEGMTMKEIAAVLKTTPKSVERLLDRARWTLRRELETYRGLL